MKKSNVERNREFFERNGFSANGTAYAVLGDTFPIKDKLHEMGAHWCKFIKHWVFAEKPNDDSLVLKEVDAIDIFYYNGLDGLFKYLDKDENTMYLLKADEDAIKREKNLADESNTSSFVGEVGEKVSFEINECKCVFKSGSYGSMFYIYNFTDADNNVFVWKTSKWIDTEDVEHISGTIKAHNDYNGIMQNIISSCRVR